MDNDFEQAYSSVRIRLLNAGFEEREVADLITDLSEGPPISEAQVKKLGEAGFSPEDISMLCQSLGNSDPNLLKALHSREQTNYSVSSSPMEERPYAPTGYGRRGGSCFIATAAYGTHFSKQLYILENFRDKILSESALGRKFINAYYALSPPVANYIRSRPILRTTVRTFLAPLVWIANRFSDRL
jgi:hypothetical protein